MQTVMGDAFGQDLSQVAPISSLPSLTNERILPLTYLFN